MHTRQGVAVPAQGKDSALALESLDASDGMYRKEFNLNGTLRHSVHCRAMFNRRDWKCHRCLELLRGSLPRDGWMTDYLDHKVSGAQRKLPW